MVSRKQIQEVQDAMDYLFSVGNTEASRALVSGLTIAYNAADLSIGEVAFTLACLMSSLIAQEDERTEQVHLATTIANSALHMQRQTCFCPDCLAAAPVAGRA